MLPVIEPLALSLVSCNLYSIINPYLLATWTPSRLFSIPRLSLASIPSIIWAHNHPFPSIHTCASQGTLSSPSGPRTAAASLCSGYSPAGCAIPGAEAPVPGQGGLHIGAELRSFGLRLSSSSGHLLSWLDCHGTMWFCTSLRLETTKDMAMSWSFLIPSWIHQSSAHSRCSVFLLQGGEAASSVLTLVRGLRTCYVQAAVPTRTDLSFFFFSVPTPNMWRDNHTIECL